MAKVPSPLLGYNNNVRHRGRLFHIQTEDSGVNHPHIITHLFMDGGRILKSLKKSYAEHVGNAGLSEVVRVLMKEQHKAMLIALRDGQFDHLVENAKTPKTKAVAKDLSADARPNEGEQQPERPSEPTATREEAPSSPDVQLPGHVGGAPIESPGYGGGAPIEMNGEAQAKNVTSIADAIRGDGQTLLGA